MALDIHEVLGGLELKAVQPKLTVNIEVTILVHFPSTIPPNNASPPPSRLTILSRPR